MAHVEDRWKRSDRDRKGGRRRGRRWRARYRGPDGRERSKSFHRKVEAERWLAKVEVDKARGQWVDARLGRTTVRELAERTEAARVNRRPSTKARDASLLRSRVFSSFGDWAVADVTSADVRAWVGELDTAGLAPTTVRKCYQLLARTFEDAVGDGILAVSPCRNVRLPKNERSEPVLLTPGQVESLAAAVPDRYRALMLSAAYTGLRWGELAGLRTPRIDFLRRKIDVAEILVEVGAR